MTKNILITGSRGFIGSCLVKELESKEYALACYDGDVRKPFKHDGPVDVVIHLAGRWRARNGGPERSVYDINILGALNALEFCRGKGAKCIMMSTCGVYGNPRENPVKEGAETNPFNAYTRSKVIAEELCRGYAEDHGVSAIILRLFNSYGARQQPQFLIPSIVDAIRRDKRLELHDPNLRRDYVHIDDVVRAIVKAVEYETAFELFNIGSGKSYSVQEVVNMIEKLMGKRLDHVFDKTKDVLIKNIEADISHSKEKLRWAPEKELEAGLAELLQQT